MFQEGGTPFCGNYDQDFILLFNPELCNVLEILKNFPMKWLYQAHMEGIMNCPCSKQLQPVSNIIDFF